MYINMECKQSYWEDTKPSVNIEDNSYHGNKSAQSRKNENVSPPIQPTIHDDICKEENSIYQYCDRNFNFSANIAGGITSEEDDYHHSSPKRKIAVSRDPMSHRIIEKRRRDRMNNCLADLSRLIPAEYLKKGRGRIEKTEIIEMAIKHMKFLQTQTCGSKPAENYEPKADTEPRLMVSDTHYDNVTRAMEQEAAFQKQYKFGYQDCLAETMHFLVELEGFFPSDTLCVRLMNHLQKYYEKVAQVDNGKSVDHGGSPENVVLPHTYDPSPTNSYQSSTFEDTNKKRSRRSSSISVVQGDDNSSNEPFNGTSQLREILVSPHSTSYYSPAARPNIIRHSSPESSPPPSIEATSTDIASPAGSLFKFKSYIKERFSAERSNLHHSSLPPPPKSPHSPVVVHGNSRKVNDTSSKTSTNPHQHQPVKRVDDHYASSIVSRSVPIFALHAKGAFYIPLSVDSNILTPFLSEWNNDYGVNNDFPPSMVLHPVTISVNFNRPLVTKSNECKVSITPAIAHYAATPVHIVPECR